MSKFNGSYKRRKRAASAPKRHSTKTEDRAALDEAVEAFLSAGGRITRCPMGSAVAGVLCTVRPLGYVPHRGGEGDLQGWFDVASVADRVAVDGD